MSAIKVPKMPEGLRKNFKPLVHVKKDTVCSLKRHYRGAIREVIGYWDLLAGQDEDRFVWASDTDTQRHAKNYKTKGLYSLRIVKRIKKSLREQGMISEQIERIRGGVMRSGFIVRAHNSVARPHEKGCLFPAPSSLVGSPPRSPVSSLVGSPVSSPMDGSKFTGEFTSRFTTSATQMVEESIDSGNFKISRHEDGHEDGASILVTVKPLSRDSRRTHGRAALAQTEKAEDQTPQNRSVSFDVTMTKTIGQAIETDTTFETLVCLVSDNEYNQSVLDGYEHKNELYDSCVASFKAHAHLAYDRKSLADVMDFAMRHLKRQTGLNAPSAWMPVFKKLRESGGKCTMSGNRHTEDFIAPHDIWSPGCTFTCYRDELKPFESQLRLASLSLGLPTNFGDAYKFLNSIPNPAPELIQVRDALKKRIPVAVVQ